MAFDEGIAENSDSEDIVNSGADFEDTAKTAFVTKRVMPDYNTQYVNVETD